MFVGVSKSMAELMLMRDIAQVEALLDTLDYMESQQSWPESEMEHHRDFSFTRDELIRQIRDTWPDPSDRIDVSTPAAVLRAKLSQYQYQTYGRGGGGRPDDDLFTEAGGCLFKDVSKSTSEPIRMSEIEQLEELLSRLDHIESQGEHHRDFSFTRDELIRQIRGLWPIPHDRVDFSTSAAVLQAKLSQYQYQKYGRGGGGGGGGRPDDTEAGGCSFKKEQQAALRNVITDISRLRSENVVLSGRVETLVAALDELRGVIGRIEVGRGQEMIRRLLEAADARFKAAAAAIDESKHTSPVKKLRVAYDDMKSVKEAERELQTKYKKLYKEKRGMEHPEDFSSSEELRAIHKLEAEDCGLPETFTAGRYERNQSDLATASTRIAELTRQVGNARAEYNAAKEEYERLTRG